MDVTLLLTQFQLHEHKIDKNKNKMKHTLENQSMKVKLTDRLGQLPMRHSRLENGKNKLRNDEGKDKKGFFTSIVWALAISVCRSGICLSSS